ncbi:hypothetical protein Voc01_057100 [Virgisporangium ochraceum]|uniref:Heat shock protein 70 n=1 Tax=Virgisporangium ochraceum TaxID=65505 RepID=A0A8J3ZYX7_9ACTN|nr:hypothetical protein Voc01_057100 [Virgisporangium ochraceum]
MAQGYRLGIDFGTSHTVAVLRRDDGMTTPLLFDSSPLLASGVSAGTDSSLLTGADAQRAAVTYPGGYEPSPKRLVDDATVWLGDREFAVVEVVAAVLDRVTREARRVAGGPPAQVVVTHPAAWGSARLGTLTDAARRAGLGDVRLLPEPVAAAAYFMSVLGREVRVGHSVVAFDLGAGTFDVSVVRRGANGLHPVASNGLADLGGADLDAVVVDHARAHTPDAAEAWSRLDWPSTPADQRARRALWDGARAVKEQLSRHAVADLFVPLVEVEIRLTREEFERSAAPLLARSVEMTVQTLRASRVPRETVAGVFLVGGSTRVPLVASMVHRALRLAPTVIEQPELAVAGGSLEAVAVMREAAPAPEPPAMEPTAPEPPVMESPVTAPLRAPRRRSHGPAQRPTGPRVAEVLTRVALAASVVSALALAWSVFRVRSPADAATVLGLQSAAVVVLLPLRPWRLIQPSPGIDFVLAVCASLLAMIASEAAETDGFFVPLSAVVTTIAAIAALCALMTQRLSRRLGGGRVTNGTP